MEWRRSEDGLKQRKGKGGDKEEECAASGIFLYKIGERKREGDLESIFV